METFEEFILKDIKHNQKIIRHNRLYSIKSFIVKMLIKSGIILDYAYPYILSALIMLNIGFYKKNKPFIYDDNDKIVTENIYYSNNKIRINNENNFEYEKDCVIYRTPWELVEGKYTAKEITFQLNSNYIRNYDIPYILKMNYEELNSIFNLYDIKNVYKNEINNEDAFVAVIYHDETIPEKILHQKDVYSLIFIILVILEGYGISKINKIYFKNYARNKLNELDKEPLIYGKKEIYILNEMIKNDKKNLDYICNSSNLQDKPKLRIK